MTTNGEETHRPRLEKLSWVVNQPAPSPFFQDASVQSGGSMAVCSDRTYGTPTPSIVCDAAGQIDSVIVASQIVVRPLAEIILVNLSPVIPSAALSATPAPPSQSQTQVILKTERKSLLIPISAIFSEGIKPPGVRVHLGAPDVLFDGLVRWNQAQQPSGSFDFRLWCYKCSICN